MVCLLFGILVPAEWIVPMLRFCFIFLSRKEAWYVEIWPLKIVRLHSFPEGKVLDSSKSKSVEELVRLHSSLVLMHGD